MRSFPLAILLVVSLAIISCQQYSAGLQKGSSSAPETSAIGALRTIAQAQTAYSISNSGHYASFERLVESGLLDARFGHSNPEVYDYIFTMRVTPEDGATPAFYSCSADPAPTSNSGGRHFYIDSDAQGIRVNVTQPAKATDDFLRP